MALHPQSIKDFPSLLEYLNTELDWDVDPDDAQEYSFEYTPQELGLDAKYVVGIKKALQIRTAEETLPVFWIEFENKRLPVVVLRRILRAFAKKKRPGANSSSLPTMEKLDDMFFICALGEGDNRGLTLAHFRPLENKELAQLRTFGWDGHETQFHYLEKHLRDLNWDNRQDWSRAFIAEHGRAIKDSKELALALAEFAREIRDATYSLYEVENDSGNLHELHRNFGALLGSTTPEQFADTVAQTITSALLAVRFEGHALANVALTEIQTKIPFTNPFLTEFIEHLARIGFNSAQGVDFDDLGIEDLKQFLNAVNIEAIKEKFGSTAQGGAQDPIIHFYETFLAAYDSQERMKRGVYYTPKPVVDFIVRGVDHLLRTELGFPLGLADASQDADGHYNVTILDPATGTGTFLVAVVESIYATMTGEWKKTGKHAKEFPALWDEYVSRDLLPRLFGFELMMAPYTVAHLKIGLKLVEFGYKPRREERLNVFLTNTLEQSQQLALDLPGFLSKEASEAARVKNSTKITVIVGNPPYSGHSANITWTAEGKKKILTKIGLIVESYKKDVPSLSKPGKAKWLQNDYVKFLAFAQDRILETDNGVIAYITDNGYLNKKVFLGLRRNLSQLFDHLYILNLHGDSRIREVTPEGSADQNVFDIMQGVAITLAIKQSRMSSNCYIRYGDVWGKTNEKYNYLNKSNPPTIGWKDLHVTPPKFLFVPREGDLIVEYEDGWGVEDIFDQNGDPALGFVTQQDDFAISFSAEESAAKVERLLTTRTEDEARQIFKLCSQKGDNAQWKYNAAKLNLADGTWKTQILPVLYLPFDIRSTVFNSHVAVHHRKRLTSHFLVGENIGLCLCDGYEIPTFNHVYCTTNIATHHAASNKEGTYIFPLYLYEISANSGGQLLGTNGRRANLAPAFVAQLGGLLKLQWISDGQGDGTSTFGPEDVLAYIYAIFHAPSYRSRYAEFLKIDFPRVPLTSDAALFWELVEQGRQLIDLHLLKLGKNWAETLDDGHTPQGEVAAGYPKYENGKVVINKAGEGFEGVEEAVWNFHIGGYQVAHKWLKDRKGRVLTAEDATHYRKILTALEITIEHMCNVDMIIEEHGGWPLPGSQDVTPPADADVRSFFAARDATAVEPRPVKTTPQQPQATLQPAREAPAPISEYSREELVTVLGKVVGRKWTLREDAIRDAVRKLGYARTGRHIHAAFKSAINGAIRRGVLEYDGDYVRRMK